MRGADAAPSDRSRLRHAPPAALGALLGVEAPLAGRLRDCGRIAPRLVLAASRRLGPLPGALTATQERMLRMDSETLQALALRAGAVRHARAVLRVLEGPALRAITSSIGSEARDAALRWHALADGAPQADGAMPLEERIRQAGQRCLTGWCDMQPMAVGGRVRLLLLLPEARSAEAALGARIVEALVGAND